MVYFQFAGTLVVALKTSAWSKPSLGSLLGLSTQEEGQGKKNHEVPIPHWCTEVAEKTFSRTWFPTWFAPA